METLSRTLPTRTANRTEKSTFCKLSSLQILQFRPKVFVNDWLTVTNRIPPVNGAQGHRRLPKTRPPGVTLGQITEVPADTLPKRFRPRAVHLRLN